MREHRQGQIVFGRYELERLLAKGGMSQVWVARDRKLQREVAVKLMSTGFAASDRAQQRFEREAMLVAKLHSPHIVQIYDYGVDHLSPFIVMELLTGEDLRRRVKRERRLTMDQVSRVLMQTAMGLTEAHSAGLIHRDLKPANIHLARTKTGEIVKILDFGVAKAATNAMDLNEDELTQQGSMVGTPQYMSPEQVRCLPDIDHRADLWALGIIVYRTLTGILPFRGRTGNDLSVNICTGEFPPATEVNPELPSGVDDFLRVALATSPRDRFDSARAMAESFTQITDEGYRSLSTLSHGELISEPPESIGSQSGLRSRESDHGSATTSGAPPSYSGISITGTAPNTGISGYSVAAPLATTSAPSVAPQLLASQSGSMSSTMFEGGLTQPQRRRRRVIVVLGAVALLLAAGIVGSVIGGGAADTRPAAPAGPSEEPSAPPAATEVVDLDEPGDTPEPSAAPSAPRNSPDKAQRPPSDTPAPRPQPGPQKPDDFDPFKSRK